MGLLEVLDNPDKEYTQDAPWLEEFKQKCLWRRHRLYRLFNIIVTKKSKAVHLLNRFLEKIGLGLTCDQKRVEGQRVRTYKLNTKKLNNSDRNAILNAFDRKWSQTKTKYDLEGVTELERKPYTNNQQESSVTEGGETQSEKPFWWGHSCDRYSPEFEVTVHTAYWWLLAASTFDELQLAKVRITQLSHNLGWGSHQLLNWLFERMPDEAIDYVEGLMTI